MDYPTMYGVRIMGLNAELITLLVEAENIVGAVMKAEEHVGKLNDALRNKFPESETADDFFIESVDRTRMVLFTDEWLSRYVAAVELEGVEDE